MLLHNTEEMVPLHVGYFLAAGDGQDFALDLQDGRAICELDAEAVAGEGQDVFFENERFGLRGDELGEDGDGRWGGAETGHGDGGFWGCKIDGRESLSCDEEDGVRVTSGSLGVVCAGTRLRVVMLMESG